MDIRTLIMYFGIAVAGIGVLLLAFTTKWQGGWGYPYRTTNKPLARLGWLLLLIGLAILIGMAYLNGQLG